MKSIMISTNSKSDKIRKFLRRRNCFVRRFGIILNDEQTKEMQQSRHMKKVTEKRQQQRQHQEDKSRSKMKIEKRKKHRRHQNYQG